MFPASIRSNADPSGTVSDEAISQALRKVGLWDVLSSKTDDEKTDPAKVLDTMMDKNILSNGQKQMFCLARAMLKKGKLILLDEPTSR